jgi:transcriptional regulator with XRE-family HTH domain
MEKRKYPFKPSIYNFMDVPDPSASRIPPSRIPQAAGYSQRDLAAEIGISHRMIAYYEGETEYPPAHLLPQLAKVLGVSTDELLGLEKKKRNGKVRDTRLWRRFSQVEKLPPAERKPIIQVLDAFLRGKKAESM